MSVKRDNENNQYWIDYGIDLKARKIMVDDDIEDFIVGFAIRAIHKMEEASNDPIDIYINSNGGSVYDGLALYDTMRQSKSLIRTHAVGKIMSMALIVYLGGDHRFASSNATFMNHTGYADCYGKLYEREIDLKEQQRLEDVCNSILEERTGVNKTWWEAEAKYEDKFYDPNEAKKLGVVTHGYE